MGDVDLTIARLRTDLTAIADAARVAPMSAYMKDQFDFLGVSAPARKHALRDLMTASRSWDADRLVEFANGCWEQPEREFQHAAVDILRRRVRTLDADRLPDVGRLIRLRSWWDTVDALASDVVGPLVSTHPALVAVMDDWIDDDDMWIRRSALLHQLKFREATDEPRLFDDVDRRCHETEFFIRKACGWALRQHARVRPDAVRAYVASRGDRLSGLTRREALKHLE